jgi:kynureninase
LGLQPKEQRRYVDEVMDDWANLAVEGHFMPKKTVVDYHKRFAKPLGKIVGALASEVTVMNTLTVNLHLLMVSFTDQQNQDIRSFAKKKAFPSDQYMFPKSSDFHGYKSEDAVEIKRREG